MAWTLGILVLLAMEVITTTACPDMCTCMGSTIVNCANKGLKILPQGIPTVATELYLAHNNLGSDDLMKISEFVKLEVLDMSHNNIETMKDGKLPRTLRTILLDHNQMNFEGDDPFGNTENSLEKLTLQGNKISREISILTYYAHKKLNFLDLSYNEIPSVTDNTVFPMSLLHLNIRNNPIDQIYTSTFRLTTQLLTLDLINLQMSSMKSSYFKNCESLEKLYMGGPHLSTISSITFKGLTSLTKLVIEDSNLSSLPAYVFAETSKLSVLHLNENTFDHFEDKLFGNKSELLQLYLIGNRGDMKFNAKLFNNFRHIQYLSIAGNNITIFPSYLGRKLPKLKVLDLSFNKLTELQTNSNFESLVGINVSNNEIYVVKDDFFAHFSILLGADLSKNKISKLKRQWLDDYLTYIVTSNNSWACDCDMKEAISKSDVTFSCHVSNEFNLLYNYEFNTSSDACVVCSSPPIYDGKMFTNISNYLEECREFTTPVMTSTFSKSIFVAVVTVSICTTCGIIIVILLVRRHRRKEVTSRASDPSDPLYSQVSDRTADSSLYHQIPESGNGYEYAMSTDHVYCSVKQKKAEESPTPHVCKDTITIRRYNPSNDSESPYVDDILGTHDSIKDSRRTGAIARPERSPTDAYQTLPPPPTPPIETSGNKMSPQSAYEVEMAANKRKASYMDFSESPLEEKKVQFRKPTTENKRYESNNTYEMD
ncbi:uncharacterized protein LOC144428130 [Styela clava]